MPTRWIRLTLLCATSVLASATALHASDETDCTERATRAVQRRYADVKDLSARFSQTTQTVGPAATAAPSVASGRVVLAVPGRMRWTYEEPSPSVVVSDGETLWLYDPEFGEVQRLPVADAGYLSGAAVQFLLGRGDLARDFEITALRCEAERATLELVPRAPASYEKLRIEALSSGHVASTEIVDLLGNVTRVRFEDVRLNQEPAASTFRFETPEGVRVIDLAR
jgi:outer membrane lipoprotein carrier protein